MSTLKLEVPKWMNDKFFKTCIKNDENYTFKEDDILIKNTKVEYAVPLGVNFMSVIYDVTIEFSIKNTERWHTTSFIAKIILDVDDIIALEADSQMFLREIDMYNEVLPDLQKVLEKAGINKKLACRCVYSSTMPFRMAMENLKANGYEMADKYIGLDLEHCKMTLERLAFLHGASMHSYAMKKALPKKPVYYIPLIRDSKLRRKAFSSLCEKRLKQILNILEMKGGYEIVIQYLVKNFGDDPFGYACQNFKYVPDNQFNALLHGDAWIANVMFKYDENRKLVDLMLLDYQLSNYASVASDFLFFFFSSANDDVREHHFTTLIAFYHESLANVLNRLGHTEDIPTIEDFKIELKRTNGCGLTMLFFMLPSLRVKITDASKNNDNGISMDTLVQLGEDNFDSPEFQKTLFLGINSLRAEGYFDSSS